MKTKSITRLLLTALTLGFTALTAHAHSDEKKAAGPNGGRVISDSGLRAEFFVTDDRKVQITFLDDHHQPVAPAGQTVVVTAGDRAAPATLNFTRSGNMLVSDGALPPGFSVPTVVQITPEAGAKAITEKFNVRLSKCPECKHPEYACTCEGH